MNEYKNVFIVVGIFLVLVYFKNSPNPYNIPNMSLRARNLRATSQNPSSFNKILDSM